MLIHRPRKHHHHHETVQQVQQDTQTDLEKLAANMRQAMGTVKSLEEEIAKLRDWEKIVIRGLTQT